MPLVGGARRGKVSQARIFFASAVCRQTQFSDPPTALRDATRRPLGRQNACAVDEPLHQPSIRADQFRTAHRCCYVAFIDYVIALIAHGFPLGDSFFEHCGEARHSVLACAQQNAVAVHDHSAWPPGINGSMLTSRHTYNFLSHVQHVLQLISKRLRFCIRVSVINSRAHLSEEPGHRSMEVHQLDLGKV
jgi:hypothetical protein